MGAGLIPGAVLAWTQGRHAGGGGAGRRGRVSAALPDRRLVGAGANANRMFVLPAGGAGARGWCAVRGVNAAAARVRD
ncbi:hypothetical protein CBM2629_B40338 [Cupriavidus taiwanensis]|nr:hypothetical protein CBM2629_B40338 [Cupriavidus taiwanensis]